MLTILSDHLSDAECFEPGEEPFHLSDILLVVEFGNGDGIGWDTSKPADADSPSAVFWKHDYMEGNRAHIDFWKEVNSHFSRRFQEPVSSDDVDTK